MREEDVVNVLLLVHGAQQLLVLLEQLHPGVKLRSAVVAVHHGHQITVRRGYHIYHLVGLGELFLHHNHGEGRGSGRYVARAGPYGVGGHHAGACVAFRRAQRHARLQMARDVQPLGAQFRELSGGFAGAKDLGQDVLELPRELPGSHQGIELLNHIGPVISGGGIYGQHAGGIAHAQHLLSGEFPVDVAR